jgi:hypothetical protein
VRTAAMLGFEKEQMKLFSVRVTRSCDSLEFNRIQNVIMLQLQFKLFHF